MIVLVRMAVMLTWLVIASPSASLADYVEQRVAFSITFAGVHTNLAVMSATVMPGETLHIETSGSMTASSGDAQTSATGWDWRAPSEPGHTELKFEQDGEFIVLNVFVLTPFDNGRQESLNGFRIGSYVAELHRGLEAYAAPRGFIEVTSDNHNIHVSPHFTLGQFLCKQQPGFEPAYLLLRPKLLLNLELLLQAVNDAGFDNDSLHIMSGYRTPWYNRSIGNRTSVSRHLYGDSADIFIDADSSGWMDDLTGDGKVTRTDAEWLADVVSKLDGADIDEWTTGGLSIYGPTSSRGPFIHMDTRGYKARW